MIKAVIYARVSSKDQEREGFSIPAQLRILTEYADKNRIKIVEQFKESESAGKAGRTAFGKMLSLLNADKTIKAILVEKTDRLYRNFKDKVIIDDLGIDVHFVKDNRIIGRNSKPSEKFVNDIETAQARYYLNNLSDEVKKGQRQKARSGQYPGGCVPIGYKRNRLAKSIVLDPDRSQIIRNMFKIYSGGDISLDSLHEETLKMGLTYPRTGRRVARSEMERILKRVFYTGKFSWKGEIYQGDHPAIVDPILFEKVQNTLQGKGSGRFTRRNFTFNRLVQCGDCYSTVTAEIKKGKYIYYHCTGYGKKHKVDYVPEPKLDRLFTGVVQKATLPYDFYEYLRGSLDSELEKLRINNSRERDRLEMERDKIKSDIKRAYQDKIDGSIDDAFFKEVYNEYQNRLNVIEYRLDNLSDQIEKHFDAARETIELSYQAESQYLNANSMKKRYLLKSILSNCLLKDLTLYPTYRKPFDAIAKGIETKNKRG